MYYLTGKCTGSLVSWDHRMLAQLSDDDRACFPVILTYKYACDQAIFLSCVLAPLQTAPWHSATILRKCTMRSG